MLTFVFSATAPTPLGAYLRACCPGLATGETHKFLRQNKIKVNGTRQPLAALLHQGDTLHLYLPAAAEARATAPPPPGPLPDILFEDQNLLALNKPAGLLTLAEEASPAAPPDSLLARALHHLGGPLLPCHRLDTGTSGVVLLAKNEDTLLFVRQLLQDHQLQKTYLCVTVGVPQPPTGHLGGYLWKDAKQGLVRILSAPRPGARPVHTSYKTLAQQGPLALLEVQLHTGRTHQIRAHMASIGTPILGDSKYGHEDKNRQYRCRYQCLCAQNVAFPSGLPAAHSVYSGLCIQAPAPWFLSLVSGNL